MCGIVAILNLDGAPVDASVLTRMTRCLAHRGPDGEDIWTDGNVGLGHRRLAIFDLSETGRQPMSSADGRWRISFNGALYDYRERGEGLRRRGCVFRGTSDTEVLVNALAADGIEVVPDLNGMFAFAAWDAETRCLHLVRDRYGVKPLYTWCNGKVFLAASEIKAILAHPEVATAVDEAALVEYFTFQNQFQDHTLFLGVSCFPPAHHQRVSPSGPNRPVRWWDYDFSLPDESLSFEDASDEIRRLLTQAVARQMAGDVRVGSYLSGGLDTSVIAAIAAARTDRLATFTCGFDVSLATGFEANFDERRDAEFLAVFLGTEHYERVIGPEDIGRSLPHLIFHLEDLRMGQSYPPFHAAHLASRFVKVALGGTGGDELFGGYPWRYYRVFRSIDRDDYFSQYYAYWQRLIPIKERGQCFQRNLMSVANQIDSFAIFRSIFDDCTGLKFETPEDHIGNSLYFECRTFLTGLLMVQDKVSAAHGLEERVPLLDNDLVDFAMRVPVRHKLGNLGEMKALDENTYQKVRAREAVFGDGKNVIRKAMKDLLPDNVLARPKAGFTPPEGSWIKNQAAGYVDEMLISGPLYYSSYIKPSYVKKILDEHRAGAANHRLRLWSFLCFEQWCRQYLAGDGV